MLHLEIKRKLLPVFFTLLQNSLMRELSFRFNSLIRIFTDITWYLVNITFFKIIYSYTIYVGNWTSWEVYSFLGTMMIIDSLYMTFFYFNVMRVPTYVRNGSLDIFLLKPINSRFLISFQTINWSSLITFLFGVSFTIYSVFQLENIPCIKNVAIYVVLIINGILLMYYLMFIGAIFSFYFYRTEMLMESVFEIFQIGMKPEFIYGQGLRMLFTYVVPVLVIVNYPAKILFDELSFFDLFWATGITVVLHLLTSFFWNYSLKKYNSATS